MVQEKTQINTTRLKGPLADLVTMRMVILFNLLRRGILLAQKRNFDLSEVQWRIMSNLGPFGPVTLNGLADLMILDRGQLSRTISGMAERGLVTRERRPGGPHINIDLTAQGQELYARMTARAVERDALLIDGIDPADVAVVERVIGQMILKAEVLLDEERELSA